VYFGFDDDQLAFRDAARDLFDKKCPPEAVRAAWDAPAGTLDRAVWDRLAEMGVLATLVPEANDGLGLDELALVLVLEEAGRAGLPHPLVETAAVAAPLVAGDTGTGDTGGDTGTGDNRSGGDTDSGTRRDPGKSTGSETDRGGTRTGDAASGDSASAPGPAGLPDAHGLGMVATDLGGPHVACAADADWLLLRDAPAGALHLVDPAAVVLTPLDTVDRARRAAAVDWQPTPETRVADDPAVIDLAFDRGAFGTAALLVGLGQRMLDLTVAYVTEREQFGVPIGSFQAVKHHLADALKELAFARPAVYRAAHSLATGAETRTRDVSMAKAMASDAARFVGRQALQCHGAIGYTVEHDLHLYLKRTWALATAWGGAAWHRDRVARAIGI
jgi:alkylation response protein AidB-like acyl-CoA dehydrogenase